MLRTRMGLAVATATLAAIGAFGMAACSSAPATVDTLSPAQSALTAIGFSDADVTTTSGQVTGDGGATAEPSAGTAPNGKGNHPRFRRLAIRRLALRGRVEHGQVTVETKNGDQTIDVQRGTITAITSTTMTVTSTDGFTLTWTIGGPLTVIEHRTQIQPGQLAAGDLIGVAGTQDGATATAKLVVVPNKAPATTGS